MTNPVFIFSVGPACGGKLVQQLVSSSNEIMVWTAAPGALNHILEAMRLTDMSLSPRVVGLLSGADTNKVIKKRLNPTEDARPYVANMRFSVKHMQRSFQQLLSNLYGLPSTKFGFQTWGVSDFTANKQTCDMLRMIYPNAKFIIVIRHPIDCLRQIKKFNLRPRDQWGRFLDEKNRLDWFAKNWATLADEFYEIPYAYKIRHEDIVSGNLDINGLNEYLGTNIIATDDSVTKPSTEVEPDCISELRVQKIKTNIAAQMKRWNYE